MLTPVPATATNLY